MKQIEWDELKNIWLKANRGIGFEDVQTAIEDGHLLADEKHHNQERYPNQKIYVVATNNYVYLVPYVEDDEKIFLKTIIPSRKAVKEHLRGGM